MRALLLLLASLSAMPGNAQDERCYPGPPLYILRELMGGEDTPERYREAVLTYAKENCRNGQRLKLVGPVGPGEAQDRLNGEVALELCYPETIYRERLARGEKAVVLFCLVEKLPE